jgi:hypothetical protein
VAIDIIIRADNWEELIGVIHCINYADIPSDVSIRMAICKDLEKTMKALLKASVDIDDVLLSHPEIAIHFNELWDNIQGYGYDISDIKIIDNSGSILMRMGRIK